MIRKPARARHFNMAEARARLSDLVRKALSGEAVVIAKHNTPLVKLVPLDQGRHRKPGSAKGQLTMSDDFDVPLDDFADYL